MRALLAAGLLALLGTAALAQTGPVLSGPGATTPGQGVPGQSVEGAPGPGGRGGWGGHPPSPELMAAMRTLREQCRADVQKLCPPPAEGEAGAQGGGFRGGARMQCLRAHLAEVSPGCRDAMSAMRAARGGVDGVAPHGPPNPPQG